MRRDFGNRTHFNHYVSRELVPLDGAAVELQKQAWELAYNTWFHNLAALPYVERLAVIDDLLSLPTTGDRLAAVVGGLPEHLRRLTQPLAFQVAVQRHLVTVGNETNPIDVAAEMDMSLPDVVTTTFEHRQHLQALEAKAAHVRAVIAAVAGNGPEAIGNGMRDLFDEWCKAPLVKTGTAPEITHKHKASVERFLTVCNGGSDMPVRSITREHIKRFFEMNNADSRTSRRLGSKHRDHVKALLALAVRLDWRENNPMDGVPFTAPARKATDGDDEEGKKPFSPAQLTAIHTAAATAWAGKPDLVLALRLLTF